MELEQQFAKNLRERRLALGLTQHELAARIRYSEKSVSKWEQGQALPPSSLLPQLARALQMDINTLFQYRGDALYFLGIDGGGTKTEFLLADEAGKTVSRCVLGGCNPVDIGLEQAFAVLADGIGQVCGDIPYEQIAVYAGLAGGSTKGYTEGIRQFLQGYPFARIGNGSDAENAVKAGLGNGNGIALILGTGAIAFTQKENKMIRFGGLGYLFEDNGSGYAFGQQAILAAIHAEMNSGPETVMLPLLLEQLGTPTVLEQLGSFYEGGKRKIASYAPIVFQAMEQGDAVATAIVEEQLKRVADLLRAAGKPLGGEKKKVMLLGSVAKNQPCVAKLLQLYLKEEFEINICDRPVVYGALLMAGMKGE